MYFGYMLDGSYLLILVGILLSVIAQIWVKAAFSRYSKVGNARGLTGAEVARKILDENGLSQIPVTPVPGELTDHYDPRKNAVFLSERVYHSPSVAAIGVAAHEVGHAVQHATGYAPIRVRSSILPATQFASGAAPLLCLLGFFMGITPLLYLGIVLFAVVTLFQLVTLPVELNASARAMRTLRDRCMLDGQELAGARKVLTAAAMTYVAALLVSLLNLLRMLALANRRR